MGGSGLAVSRRSAHRPEAVKLVSFLFRAQIESIEKRRSAPGGQPAFFNAPPELQSVKLIQSENVVHRPSIESGNQYTQVSKAYIAAVHAVLTGQEKAPEAAVELEKQLIRITGFRTGAPKTGQ
jgi:trehalose/maltose transport system substrate-binding protein